MPIHAEIGGQIIVSNSTEKLDVEGTVVWHPTLVNLYRCKIGKRCSIGSFIEIGPNVTIGDGCRIQSHCFIPEGVHIGNGVFIGPNVTFLNDKKPPSYGGHWAEVFVKDNASLGGGVVVLPGVTIGENALIGAGAVVTKDVGSNETVWGIPARIHNG